MLSKVTIFFTFLKVFFYQIKFENFIVNLLTKQHTTINESKSITDCKRN
ncbi:hypothetical protein FLAVO9AF_950004 [Flavobacterium sp. 9AF]|nr:hypothetical protein FLAVO9AF_950004 [Flavobacterium sp. 9AF]